MEDVAAANAITIGINDTDQIERSAGRDSAV